MVPNEVLSLLLFNVFVVAMLVLDLGVFQRRAHEIGVREALGWSAFWIALSILFNIGLYFWQGREAALLFFTGYLIEKSLSVDNLFVFLLLFMYFKVPGKYQHKVLFWGILGALVMRGALIATGVVLISKFHWILYLFGAFLVFAGIKMGVQKETAEVHPERNIAVRIFRKLIPVTSEYHEGKFFVRIGGVRHATLLVIVLLVVETTDLVFALDSIPAIFAITTDPFIVYTSNVFAILGLRALYFALAGMMNLFHYLKIGLSVVLAFVGAKMLLSEVYPIPILVALAVIGIVLFVSVLASILWPKQKKS